MLQGRELLAYISIKCRGDINLIIEMISNRPPINEEEVKEALSQLKCKYVTLLDKDYPQSLKNIFKPPVVLFYYGDITLAYDCRQNLGVVGSRKPSDYGKENTIKLVEKLCYRYCIVSGLADGIDGIAHREALKHNKKTIAILGCSIDKCYPSINKDIYEEIKQNGLIMSEYALDVGPDHDHFPLRNRIIAGLSSAILVTDAKMRSGTSITVGYALEGGKQIFCIPHPIGEESACNYMIRNGATLVENANDIFEDMECTK